MASGPSPRSRGGGGKVRRALAALLLILPALAGAQAGAGSGTTQPPPPPTPGAATVQTTTPAPPAAPAAVGGAAALPDSIRARFDLVRGDSTARSIAFDTIIVGGRTVAATERVPGSVATIRGDLEIFGVVDGDAVAVDGDVIVHPGGRVHGDAFAAFGRVRLEGGYVQGETRTLRGDVVTLPRSTVLEQVRERALTRSPMDATMHALKVALGWLAVLLGIGIAAFMFAGSYLETVAETIERRFARSFWAGVIGQLGMLPALLIVVVGLAITIIGALLIPFAIVAFAMAAAGVITLGILAMSQVTGRSLLGRRVETLSPRGAALKALVVGVMVYMTAWLVAAAVVTVPVLNVILGAIALVVSWVAATTGLGAVLISRGGTRRVEEPVSVPPTARVPDVMAWQTPTPVTGVVAARRPTPAARKAEGA